MSDLTASLWITLIGMGLVFVGILLLWGLMEAIVRITARFATEEEEGGEQGEESAEAETESAAEEPAVPSSGQKKRAAAAAVAVALALRKPAACMIVPAGGHNGSAWQAVTRASQLNHPTQIARKSRGSVR
jgi:Na+-transporting methylmalonyl-CoA/oxaloacetate decarboxylase gamma subunit